MLNNWNVWNVKIGPIEKMGPFLEKIVNIGKKCLYTLFSNPCLSTRECPEILKIYQIPKFDMGFQKINMRIRLKNVDFLPREK